MVSSPRKKKCNDVGLGEEVLFDLAQLLHDIPRKNKDFCTRLQFAFPDALYAKCNATSK